MTKNATKDAVILVFTENQDIAELLSGALALVPDAQTRIVATVAEAVRCLEHCTPDLVVVDLDWPHVFDPTIALAMAREALEALRACANCAGVPIIGISAELTRQQMIGLHLAEALRKPFDIYELVSAVERELRK
jgi:DNA-binding response OmpR family regulator